MVSPRDPLLEVWFPNLKPNEYVVTSPEAPEYNCIAWAAGRTDAWWEAIRGAGYYRPAHVPFDNRIDTLVSIFESLGFTVCSSDAREEGFEKVAIYGKGDVYEHAARMLPSGKWTSKLGPTRTSSTKPSVAWWERFTARS